mmetsp:Transcript_10362/g.15936  ORF Transcript_10362/g.15936 Transcript_10362/m.15936 type:complete len:112 (+) Transcript_10362:2790-3125(+)
MKEDVDFNSSLFPESLQRGGDHPKELNTTEDNMLNDDADLFNLQQDPMLEDEYYPEEAESGCARYTPEDEAGEAHADEEAEAPESTGIQAPIEDPAFADPPLENAESGEVV